MLESFQIAIDGPVAAGKGTISKLVAEKLGFLYIDTGAMYRMTALLAREKGVDWQNEAALARIAQESTMKLRNPNENEKDGRLTTIMLNNKDVSWKIRTEEMGKGASIVSIHPQVRKVLIKKQQKIANQQNVIMEGRDITHVVLANADLKIFLTASPLVRTRRRHFQLLTKGVSVTFEEITNKIEIRDKRDSSRAIDPLQIVPDAWVIDTSDLHIDKVVNMIVERVHFLMREKKYEN